MQQGIQGSPTAELLQTLKQAALEMRAAGGAAPTAQLLLQISALHRGFLALSDALMEMLEKVEAGSQQQVLWDERLGALQRELGSKLEVAHALNADLQLLASHDEELHQRNSMLCERVQQLEAQVASLHLQLEQQEASAAQAAQQEVTRALNSQLEQHLQHFEQERLQALVAAAVEQQAAQWVQARLPALLQEEAQRQAAAAVGGALQDAVSHLQKACEAATEVAAGAAADNAAMAADVRQLAAWCQQVAQAHANHEQRIERLEGEASAASAGAAALPAVSTPPPAGAPGVGTAALRASPQVGLASPEEQQQQHQVQQRQQLEDLMASMRLGQAQLDQRMRALEAEGMAPAAAAGAELAVADIAHQLAALSTQQVQQASTTQELVHSMLTDVMALARHTKVLDSELRSLRRAVSRTQQAVLDSNAVFGRALNLPPPVGPFTSFPPEP